MAAAKGSHVATMLDTKGPEIRTAMLAGGRSIELHAGQEVFITAVGDAYTSGWRSAVFLRCSGM